MTPNPKPDSTRASRGNCLILVVLWFAFYCSFALYSPPLLDDADSVHAEVAREILLRHDWVTLYANGIRYLEKAPILYWSMAASYKLFGVSAVAARVPLALAVLALALTLESFARRAFASTRAGFYAGLINLSSFGIFIFSRITIPDVIVCLWLTLSLYLFHLSEDYERPPLLLCWLFAAACALDILTKGLIGIVFPIAIVGAYLLLTRGLAATLQRLRQLHPISSILVFLALAAPWHILAGLANPTQGHPGNLAWTNGHWTIPLPTDGNVHGWTWFYFVNEQVLRYLNLRVPRDYDTVPIVPFYGFIFIWLMPWSAFLISAIARAFPNRKALFSRTLTPPAKARLFLILWAAIPLLFFSLSTRQEYYVLPALPALILLIASYLAQDSDSKASSHMRSLLNVANVLTAVGLLAAGICVYLIVHTRAPAPNTDISSLLQQNPGDYALSFGHFLDLNAQAMGMFRFPLFLTACAFGIFFTGARILIARTQTHAAVLSLAAGSFLFLFAAHQGLVIFSPTLTSYQLARAIAPQLQPPGSPHPDLIVLHGEYEAGSTLGFYLRRNNLHIWDGRSSNLWYGSFFPDAPKIFETTQSISQKWTASQRIFLWQDPNDHDRPLPPLPGPVYTIANFGGKTILSNQP